MTKRKIETKRVSGSIRFTIVDSVSKEHFKALMQMSQSYDKTRRSGSVALRKEQELNELVERINASDPEAARKSHHKAFVKKQAATTKQMTSRTESFERIRDYCDDVIGVSYEMLSPADRVAVLQQFR